MGIGVELLTFLLGVYATLGGVSWEASYTTGRRARFEFAHHGGRPYFPNLCLPYLRLDDSFG